MKSNIHYHNKLNAIGSRIKAYRQKANITQQQICNQFQLFGIDMSVNSLKKIESGDRIIKEYELAGFAKIFKVTADELLKGCIDNLSK